MDGGTLGLLFQLFQFLQAVQGSEGRNEGGHLASELGNGALHLAHQLQESRHHAVSDGAVKDTYNAPNEGCSMAGLEPQEH